MRKHHEISASISDNITPVKLRAITDIKEQLSTLIYPGFVNNTPLSWLKSYPRYFDAILKRLDKLNYSPEKDAGKLAQLKPLWEIWKQISDANQQSGNECPEIDEVHWLLEEYRVSLFAQELKTVMPVSQERVKKQLQKIRKI